jgi:hypothetical protein
MRPNYQIIPVANELILSFFLLSLFVILVKIDYFVSRLILSANEDFLLFSDLIISGIRSSEEPKSFAFT